MRFWGLSRDVWPAGCSTALSVGNGRAWAPWSSWWADLGSRPLPRGFETWVEWKDCCLEWWAGPFASASSGKTEKNQRGEISYVKFKKVQESVVFRSKMTSELQSPLKMCWRTIHTSLFRKALQTIMYRHARKMTKHIILSSMQLKLNKYCSKRHRRSLLIWYKYYFIPIWPGSQYSSISNQDCTMFQHLHCNVCIPNSHTAASAMQELKFW